MLEREDYLAWLRAVQDQKVIKVITGIRHSGKSTILKLFREDLKKRKIKVAQVQSYNFEEEKNVDLRDWRLLHQRIEEKLVTDDMNYIFLDEVQKVEHFEELVSSLFTKENVDLYITGSNAFLLSGDLATLLSGRYISLHVLPYSFKEYTMCFPEADAHTLFEQYVETSSFPEVVNMLQTGAEIANQYLHDLYETIVTKDISTRYEIRNPQVLERIIQFVMDSIGSVVSASSIANTLNSQGISIHRETVAQYLEYLSTCYLLYPVNRYDMRGKYILTNNEKYYAVDLGLRKMLLGDKTHSDIGHKIENVVYLELLRRREGNIFIGKQDEGEVDFVVQKYDGTREYFQVAYQVNDRPETLERELGPLKRIRDNYPKTLLTLDPFPENYEGILKKNLVDWLLGE